MKTPWHLWVVGTVTLLWNAGGAYDYVMVRTANEAYLDQMAAQAGAEQAELYAGYLADFPIWVSACWAFGVWGGVLGSILLLARSRDALPVFVVSFLGMLGNSVWGYFLSPTPMTQMMGTAAALFSLAIFVVAILLIAYSRSMTRQGVLR
jgi:hypothetical protein